MEKEKIIEIGENPSVKSNKDLFEAKSNLEEEYESTKRLIIELTRHMDSIEFYYNNINNEIKKRTKAT